MDRRQLLAAAGLLALAACAPGGSDPAPPPAEADRLTYGDHPSQFVDVRRRTGSGKPRGTVALIHGGFWQEQYDLTYLEPFAAAAAARGWDVASLEYRRVGGGGGYPETFDDVAAGLDALAPWLRTSDVVTLGHSAGGHLAVWAAGRPQLTGTDWASPAVTVATAISLAGVLDLQASHDELLGNGAADSLMGGPPDDRWLLADPTARIPLDVPVRCVHAPDDDLVPISQSEGYVDRATAAGADATLTEVTGGHFSATEPGSAAADQLLDVLDATAT
ncbi:alpha/beta hydrolase [Aeromicrobium alkaliterrae]|uniref:Alpha/beta hydrolase n=1 Tax=Aeromicrobium alkaliterrae TaxID=302168 RepID=A0ABP4W2T8_9ACTN